MTTSRLTAENIAEQQMLAAIRLWHSGDFISTITLAGAAEEILGKRLRKLGREPSFGNLKEAIVALSRKFGDCDPKTDQLVGDLLNQTRNEMKHYAGEEELEFDLREDSIELLERAITNFQMLSGVIHDEMISFWTAIDGT